MAHLNFSWVLEGYLAGAMGPTSRRDLIFFQQQDIRAVLRMEESTISAEIWNMFDMFEPVPDFSAPTLEQTDRMCRWIEDQIENYERPVVVTCHAGIGRTGTVLATYMVYMGYEPQAAIDLVREVRPGSIQTPDQERVVFDYAEHRKNTGGARVRSS